MWSRIGQDREGRYLYLPECIAYPHILIFFQSPNSGLQEGDSTLSVHLPTCCLSLTPLEAPLQAEILSAGTSQPHSWEPPCTPRS